jgi:hypothetical protein
MRSTGTDTAQSRMRTFLSTEGHRTRSGGQVSWLRILAAPRLPGCPVAIVWSSSPLQWRDRAGVAAPHVVALRTGLPSYSRDPMGAPIRDDMKFEPSIGGPRMVVKAMQGLRD